MAKYLDETGLAYFWGRVKSYFNTIIPTKVSDLSNDIGYISSYTETDPTVPEWAKASSKPTYTASEVGALSNARVPLYTDNTSVELRLIDNNNIARRITSIDKVTKSNISGIQISYDNGTNDGESIFIPDEIGVGTNSQSIINQIPTKVSDLDNDSGYFNEINVSSSGSGNVVTNLSISDDTITYNLGDSVTVSSSGSGNVVTGLSASGGIVTYTLGNASTTAAQIIRDVSTTDINTLKIHYVTQAEYEDAINNHTINDNDLYFTPSIDEKITISENEPTSTDGNNGDLWFVVTSNE